MYKKFIYKIKYVICIYIYIYMIQLNNVAKKNVIIHIKIIKR